MTGRPILTAAAMRAAERRAIAAGTPAAMLMARAVAAVAEATWRHAAGAPTLVLCGPGNNGGDGYVVARLLRARGVDVAVAASGDPRTPDAIAARAAWDGPVGAVGRNGAIAQAEARPVLVDALFGTGLTRALDPALAEALGRLAGAARHRIAIDLPSGVDADGGGTFGGTGPAFDLPAFDLTVALGAMKPAHRLQPAAGLCGRVVVADIGLEPGPADLIEIGRPVLPAPGPMDHKYTRGLVAVVKGAMAGAALLAAGAAQRAGAGYVMLVGGGDGAGGSGGARALVHRPSLDALADARIGAVLVGPGLGRDAAAEQKLTAAIDAGHPLVIDADALALTTADRLRTLPQVAIVTPHAGEFAMLFGDIAGSKVDRARIAAARARAVVVLKGADTVVAAPDGRVAIAAPASSWLASAGTGDVLAGTIAAMRARIADPFAAAQAGVWLHAAAADAAGPVLIADDLIGRLGPAVAACR